jgi:hypothetical protein
VLDQWYGPDDDYFKVRADDGNCIFSALDYHAPPSRTSETSRASTREEHQGDFACTPGLNQRREASSLSFRKKK